MYCRETAISGSPKDVPTDELSRFAQERFFHGTTSGTLVLVLLAAPNGHVSCLQEAWYFTFHREMGIDVSL